MQLMWCLSYHSRENHQLNTKIIRNSSFECEGLAQWFSNAVLAYHHSAHFVCISHHFRCLFYSTVKYPVKWTSLDILSWFHHEPLDNINLKTQAQSGNLGEGEISRFTSVRNLSVRMKPTIKKSSLKLMLSDISRNTLKRFFRSEIVGITTNVSFWRV